MYTTEDEVDYIRNIGKSGSAMLSGVTRLQLLLNYRKSMSMREWATLDLTTVRAEVEKQIKLERTQGKG